MLLERSPHLGIEFANGGNICTPQRIAVDQRCDRPELAGLDPGAVGREPPDAPVGEIERDVLVDMAVEPDLAFGERALGLVEAVGAVELGAAVAPDVRIDP